MKKLRILIICDNEPKAAAYAKLLTEKINRKKIKNYIDMSHIAIRKQIGANPDGSGIYTTGDMPCNSGFFELFDTVIHITK